MNVSYTHAFQRQLKRLARKYRRIRADIQPILDRHMPGDHVAGVAATVLKVRVSNSDANRGRSGGYRILYYVQTEDDIVLLTIYSKSEQGDVSINELREILHAAEVM
ncbi:MAG: type II toxin-antitoxin system RelE/ParE family toxin [Gammaproteobacteria bacterium]|nr:type II toxin-antitoxin system RelE/ParE family toxin [Gammaproteobacteria bacterium]